MNDVEALKMLNASVSELRTFSDDDWWRLILYLVDRLQSYLGGKIATESSKCIFLGEGFCVDLESTKDTPDSPVNWKGVFTGAIIEGKLYVSLTVFFYSGERRMVLRGDENHKQGSYGSDGLEHAEYHFVADSMGRYSWELLGWFDDVFGEYDTFL